MSLETLTNTMEHMFSETKGILAADESINTIGKRFESINIPNTETNRRDYRLLLAQTPNLEEYIHSVILFEETFDQKDNKGTSIPDLFLQKGILPGIKIDKGLVNLPNSNEKITQGLEGIEDRLKKYQQKGAKFAKWRNIYNIGNGAPTISAIKAGANQLALYASYCQFVGLVPIVEPEVLIDGNHSIEHCAHTTELVLHELFNALFIQQVKLELMVLKPSMITCGKLHQPFSSTEDIADFTLHIFRNHVPAAVPTINFLSGGQSSIQATVNLNAINEPTAAHPWILSFSYGRALQEDCLKVWGGNPENINQAQEVLLHRAKMNSLAAQGKYHENMEK